MAKGKTKQNPCDQHLADAVNRAFAEAMEERKGRALTAEEKKRISNSIEMIDPGEDIEEYKFNLISKLVSSGVPIKEAEIQVGKEAKAIYETESPLL